MPREALWIASVENVAIFYFFELLGWLLTHLLYVYKN